MKEEIESLKSNKRVNDMKIINSQH